MAGLARMAKIYGAIIINGKRFVWDYVADEAVQETEMKFGSKRHRDSEKKRAEIMRMALTPNVPAKRAAESGSALGAELGGKLTLTKET